MKRALVTGAGGYLGSRLTRRLASRGTEVVVLARNLERTRANLAVAAGGDIDGAIVGGASLDLADAAAHGDQLEQLCRGCDVVFHLGADLAYFGSEKLFATNVAGTAALYEAALRAGVERFVFASSVEATGSSPLPAPRGVSEYGILAPYGLSKLCAEERLLAHGALERLCILRLGVLVGEGDSLRPGLAKGLVGSETEVAALRDVTLPVLGTDRAIEALIDRASSQGFVREHLVDRDAGLAELCGPFLGELTGDEARESSGTATLGSIGATTVLLRFLLWPTPELAGRRLR